MLLAMLRDTKSVVVEGRRGSACDVALSMLALYRCVTKDSHGAARTHVQVDTLALDKHAGSNAPSHTGWRLELSRVFVCGKNACQLIE
jgi:hypothetical protein